MTGSRVLVTGATGAAGACVVRELLAQGHEPIGYDLSADFRFAPDIEGQFEFIRGDVLDWPRLSDTVRRYRPAAIIHMAYLLPDLARANPYMAVQVNVVGTANMVELARQNDLRLVFTSTKGVMAEFDGEYGYPTYKPVNEDFPVIPPVNNHTLYNDTKLFNEHYLDKCHQYLGLDHVILRFGSMYGPGRVRHGGRAVDSEMVEAAFYGRPFRLAQGGDECTDMVYLGDVARGCILAAFARNLSHRTFIIATGQVYSLRDVAAELRALFPNADLEVGTGQDPSQLGFRPYARFDISRARAELGYEPRYLLPAGIRDFVGTLELMEAARRK